jgi:dTDP-4-amino-4,6-dideoxygalactose transaminase
MNGKKYNPYDIVKKLEEEMARYANAPYAVAVDSCSSALLLCCKYLKIDDEVLIPKYTYPSVPCAVIHAGGKVKFDDWDWQTIGAYRLEPYHIVDSAKCLCRGMYNDGHLICLSFHGKKILPIGRGGMILTDSEHAYEWFRTARFDGRHEKPLPDDTLAGVGHHMIMLPEEAARGLELMQWLKDENIGDRDEYTDLSKYKFYTEANR